MSVPNLPAQPTTFIGREQEIAEIRNRLNHSDCRLLTLVGSGGIGKTRLAIEAAQQITLPHGVHFVALQPLTSPDFIVSAIAEVVGFQFYPGNDPKKQLLDYLCEKSMLLILDNFEHLLDGLYLLSEILASASNTRILATSRERLNLREEWVLDVAGLSYPNGEANTSIEDYSAVQLFVQKARRVQSDFALTDTNQSAVTRICRLVGGMPLGIELAAGWARVLPCQQIADEIERSLDILETPAHNVEPRHRTMRAAFEPTWTRLSDEEREVFKKLSVFRGGFTRVAAEHITEASLPILSALADKSLLRLGVNGRYDLHELLRQYAAEQLETAGETEAARDVHSAFYAAFLQEKWGWLRSERQVTTLAEIGDEFDNVRAAWRTMVEKHKINQLSMSVYPVWYFSDLRGHFQGAIDLFKQAEDMLRPIAGNKAVDRAIGQMLSRLAWFSLSVSKQREGKALAEEGLAILRKVGSPEDIVLAFRSLFMTQDRLDEISSLKLTRDVCQMARRTGDRWLLLFVLTTLTWVENGLGDLDRARQSAQECLDLAETCGDLWLKAATLEIVSYIARVPGDYATPKQLLEQSLILFEAVGQVVTIAGVHIGLGNIACEMGDHADTFYHARQSLRLLADYSGDTPRKLWTLMIIANLWAAQDKYVAAIELFNLIHQHPESMRSQRVVALRKLRQLNAKVSANVFAAAQERGKKLELRTVMHELIPELIEVIQAPAVVTSKTPPHPLTKREVEILSLIADGLSNRSIAEQLFLSPGTVKWYLSEIYDKLDVNGRTQAVTRARAMNLLT